MFICAWQDCTKHFGAPGKFGVWHLGHMTRSSLFVTSKNCFRAPSFCRASSRTLRSSLSSTAGDHTKSCAASGQSILQVEPQCYRTPLLRISARGCPHTVIFLCGLKNIHISSRNEVSGILHTRTHVKTPLEYKHCSKVAFIGWVLMPRYFRPKRHAHDPYIPQY